MSLVGMRKDRDGNIIIGETGYEGRKEDSMELGKQLDIVRKSIETYDVVN